MKIKNKLLILILPCIFLLFLLFCNKDKEKTVQDSQQSLAGADVVIKNFIRTSYKNGKISWILKCKESYVFIANEKKNKAKKQNKNKVITAKQNNSEIQSHLVENLIKNNIADFNVEGKSIIIDFKLDHYEKGKLKTKIKGEYGYIVNNSKNLHIEKNVVARSTDGRILKSDYLDYNSETEKLHTLAPVHIEAEEGIMEGIGMSANADLSWIKILKPVGLANRNKGSF